MTNPDTNTLNGALEQLGITMADNLNTMGVSDADPSDGLTTLAGKILEIAPVPPTPTPASLDLSLTAGKQILSYVDVSSGTEYATFTATVLDQNDDPLPGVSVSIYKDNVLWYTAETGAGGTISKTYDSEGVGDVSFHAVCGSFVTETYDIEDCLYYADSTKISNWNNVGSGSNSFKVSTYSISPSSFSVEMKVNTLDAQIMVGNQSSWLGGINFLSPYYLYTHSSSGGTVTDSISNPLTSDIWRMEVEDTTIRLYRNNNLIITKTNCKVDYPKTLRLYPQNKSASIDYVKVKPL